MSDINEVVVTGRITRDAELRQTPNGTSVTDIGIASNRVWSCLLYTSDAADE